MWADSWQGPELVIYGHTPWEEIYTSPKALGIDTGCLLGGKLTACVFPAKKIIQVDAKKAYVKKPDRVR